MPLQASATCTRAMSFTETSRGCVNFFNFVSCDFDTQQGNILVDDSGRARIADVGLAIITRGVDSELSTSGDEGHGARWAAPEILNDQGGYSKEADVFSFAMVMSEVGRRISTTFGVFAYYHQRRYSPGRFPFTTKPLQPLRPPY